MGRTCLTIFLAPHLSHGTKCALANRLYIFVIQILSFELSGLHRLQSRCLLRSFCYRVDEEQKWSEERLEVVTASSQTTSKKKPEASKDQRVVLGTF